MSRVKKCKLRPLTAKIEKKYLSYEFDIHDIEVNELRESLLKALEVLSTAREIKIIKMLYGIGVDRSYTLEEIGRKFDVTRERIRQIARRSLCILKTSCPGNSFVTVDMGGHPIVSRHGVCHGQKLESFLEPTREFPRCWVKLYEGTTRPYVRMSEQSLNAERRASGGRRER